jgi:hypothetical protein
MVSFDSMGPSEPAAGTASTCLPSVEKDSSDRSCVASFRKKGQLLPRLETTSSRHCSMSASWTVHKEEENEKGTHKDVAATLF